MALFPKRPPRIALFQNVRPFYFVTFNTHCRRKLLACDPIHAAFREFAVRAHAEHAIAVGRYVIMPDHVHLFVAFPDDKQLTAWIKSLKSVLGKTMTLLGSNRPHWQQGFFDHVLRGSDSYSLKWDYVRLNPVRAGFVGSAEDWPHQGEIVRIPFD